MTKNERSEEGELVWRLWQRC